jgi:hypothetical protein
MQAYRLVMCGCFHLMVSSCDVASKMVLINRFQYFDEVIKEGPQRIIMLFNFLKVITLYCCTVHFEDSLIITHQRMH